MAGVEGTLTAWFCCCIVVGFPSRETRNKTETLSQRHTAGARPLKAPVAAVAISSFIYASMGCTSELLFISALTHTTNIININIIIIVQACEKGLAYR